MLLTKRLPSPDRPRRTLVRRGDEDPLPIGRELPNVEDSTGPKRRFPRKHRNFGRACDSWLETLSKPAWRCFEENTCHHHHRDAVREPDVRPKGGQRRNRRHHNNRNERLVHSNELNEHWNINQQCFSTHPVAEHAERAGHQVESRRGA